MPRCFLSYSSGYGHLLDPFRRLLQVLEFEVDVFDEPDLEHPPVAIVQRRIDAADAVVVLLGPDSQNAGSQPEPARWANEECIYSLTLKKPLAIIRHLKTRLPEMAEGVQTPATFDFWDAVSFQRSIHAIVKHLQDLKRQFELPPGNHPFVFTKGVIRNRIQRSILLIQVYHEAIARQPWDSFYHAIDTGHDESEDAVIDLISGDVDVDVPIGGDLHRAEIRFGKRTRQEIEYYVDVKPGLTAGEKLGYRREFELKNRFPLTRADLEARASKPGFPDYFRLDGRLYYGDVYDVSDEMDAIELAFYFPWKVRLSNINLVVLRSGTWQINRDETSRCRDQGFLQLEDHAQDGERVLTLSVRRPLMNHSYVLLYGLAE